MKEACAQRLRERWVLGLARPGNSSVDQGRFYLTACSDIDDLLREAVTSNNFTMKQAKLHNLELNGEVVQRDVKLETLQSTLDNPFAIVRTPEIDAHKYVERIEEYDKFMRNMTKAVTSPTFANMPQDIY